MLYFLGGLRGYRRRTLRHKHEQEHLQHWLAVCHEAAVDDCEVGSGSTGCSEMGGASA